MLLNPVLYPKPTRYTSIAPAYIHMLPGLTKIADGCGYTLLFHGSFSRDLDLVAVPWKELMMPWEDMLQLMQEYLGTQERWKRNMIPRPHERLCFTLALGGGPYIDLSIFPATSGVMGPLKFKGHSSNGTS